jgi:predicted SnoaL-like aldol condensation-catalyzing enzyme
MVDAEKLVRRIFDEIVDQGRFGMADELFAQNFIDHGPMGRVHGRQAFKDTIAARRAAVPDVHREIDHVIGGGDGPPTRSGR